MKSLERFEAQAAQARREAPPSIDVRGRVLAAIAAPAPRPRERVDRGLAICSALSAMAAAAAVLAVVDVWSSLSDPMLGWINPLTLVMQ